MIGVSSLQEGLLVEEVLPSSGGLSSVGATWLSIMIGQKS